MIRMTANRKLILELLAETIEDMPPPHSAWLIHNTLREEFNRQDSELATLPAISQIYRTLTDLINAGLVTATKRKEEGDNFCNPLPHWIAEYQLTKDVGANTLIKDCDDIYAKVHKAKFGVNCFGKTLMQGLPVNEVKDLLSVTKALIQRVLVADEATDTQFYKISECLSWLEDGIPLPQ